MMLLAALILCSTRPAADFALRKGDSWTAEQMWHFVSKAESIDLENDERVEIKIQSVDADGYTVAVGTLLTKSRVDGYDVPAPKDQKPLVRTYKLSPNGWPTVQPTEPDPKVARLNRLTFGLLFARTASVQSWSDPGLVGQGIPALAVSLTEGRSPLLRTLQLQEKGIDNPISGGGQITFDTVTGIALKAGLSFRSTPLPGGTDVVDLLYSFKVTGTLFSRA